MRRRKKRRHSLSIVKTTILSQSTGKTEFLQQIQLISSKHNIFTRKLAADTISTKDVQYWPTNESRLHRLGTVSRFMQQWEEEKVVRECCNENKSKMWMFSYFEEKEERLWRIAPIYWTLRLHGKNVTQIFCQPWYGKFNEFCKKGNLIIISPADEVNETKFLETISR